MLVRIVLVLCLLGPFATRPARVAAQAVPAAAAFRVPELLRGTYNSPDRAIRRDVPLRNAIRRDLESGARDFSGRPGPNYWQLEADYTIEVRLDPETQTITGSETIEMHNNSTIEMTEIVLRLDHNILRGTVPRGSSVPAENTEGIVVTRLTVNGQRVDLNPPPRALGEAPRGLAAYGMDQTVARIAPPTPITGKSTSTIQMDWHTKPYPFPQLTLQDGPSAGMEYPMVINSNQGAADHETAHQWWPMMVGTNETWYGWMDEGLNSYMNILSRADREGVEPRLDGRGQSYGPLSGNEAEPPAMWNANYGGAMYSFQTYRKTTLMLSILGGIVGDNAVQDAISEYVKAWSFKHPSPWDFAFFMSNELDQDLGWFWYSWLWTTDSVDGSIEKVAASGSRTRVTVRQDGQMPSPVVLRVEFAPEGPAIEPMPNAQILGEATAIVTWPVDVWFDGGRTFDADLHFGPRRIERITLDPSCRFPDRDPSDNVWPAGSSAGGVGPGECAG